MISKLPKRKRKSIRHFIIYMALLAVVSIAAYGYNYIQSYMQDSLATFKLVDIDVQGNHILSRVEVLELCGLESGETQLLRLNPMQVVKDLRRSPYIKAASAVRSLPSTLRIVIEERQAIAFIYGRGLNLIDAEGFLMPVPKNDMRWDLPFITGVKDRLGTLGEKTVSTKALVAAQILGYAYRLKSPFTEVISELDVSKKDDIRLRLIHGGAVARLDRENYKENIFILSQYFKKYLDWDRLAVIDYFDVRFKDQLIIKEKRG